MIALLVITDGRREHLPITIASAELQLRGPITRRVIYDDSGSDENAEWIRDNFPRFELIRHPRGRQGFGGAIRHAWSFLREETDEPWIFHLEDDFTFPREIPLDRMVDLLVRHPDLAQVALRRQPWNDEERAAGGIVELHPEDFADVLDSWERGQIVVEWLRHRRFFTTNPSLYPRRLIIEHDWPRGSRSEGRYSIELHDAGMSYAYLGSRDSGEWCHHIGHTRNGKGY